MKFTKDKARRFKWEGLEGWAYLEKKDFENATAAYIETTASHGKIKNTLRDIVYYVIEGQGEFFVGEEWTSVKQGDVVVIPKNTPYDFQAKEGMMRLFLVHTPAYEPRK
jgi:mannose-6-phosphate isomerase-like protein (cupin superfamily)